MSQLVESISAQFDKLPPHSIEGEMCLLAAMMLDKEMIGQVELVLNRAEKRVFEIAQKKVGKSMVAMEEVLHEVFEMIENRGQRGIETGFFELDDMLNGLQNGEMVIVAARPSMGKTAMAMN